MEVSLIMLALEPRVVEAVWQAILPRLPDRPAPRHPLGCHRPRVADRQCFVGILTRLVTGCSWDVAGRLCSVGETTLRRRRDEWLAVGVFDGLVDESLAGYDRIIGLDLTDTAIDASLHKAPFGGEGTGPNPTDRAKSGWKWSLVTDRHGIPFGWAIDGANRNDAKMVAATLDAAIARGRSRPSTRWRGAPTRPAGGCLTRTWRRRSTGSTMTVSWTSSARSPPGSRSSSG
ncbi:MAG: transposase [Acidimicrobiales bacterium]